MSDIAVVSNLNYPVVPGSAVVPCDLYSMGHANATDFFLEPILEKPVRPLTAFLKKFSTEENFFC